MTRLRFVLFAASLAFSLTYDAALGETARKQKGENHTVLFDESSSAANDVSLGDQIVVRLKAALGAGYSWSVESLRGDAAKYVGTQVQSSSTEDHAGVGGQLNWQLFQFQTTNVGKETLTFVYRRPWLPVSESYRRLVFVITVRGNN